MAYYSTTQKYTNSCFPCSLQICLENLGKHYPEHFIEDCWNEEMKNLVPGGLNSQACNTEFIHEMLSKMNLDLNSGFIITPEDLRNFNDIAEATHLIIDNKLNNFLANNSNIGIVAGIEHANAICKIENKWFICNPSDGSIYCSDSCNFDILEDNGQYAIRIQGGYGGNEFSHVGTYFMLMTP